MRRNRAAPGRDGTAQFTKVTLCVTLCGGLTAPSLTALTFPQIIHIKIFCYGLTLVCDHVEVFFFFFLTPETTLGVRMQNLLPDNDNVLRYLFLF